MYRSVLDPGLPKQPFNPLVDLVFGKMEGATMNMLSAFQDVFNTIGLGYSVTFTALGFGKFN